MKRISLIFLLSLCFLTGIVFGQDSESGQHPLLEMLARVPDTPAVREGGMVVYADMQAAETARGLPPLDSAKDWTALSSEDQRVWLMAAPSFAMLPDVAMNLMKAVEGMPRLLGIDLFAIDRTLYFGQPPQIGHILQGSLDPGTIGVALEGRGYTSTIQGAATVWCPLDGCDSGLKVNPMASEPGNPFGGRLGRQEPLAYAVGYVFESADYPILNAIMDAANGAQPSLGGNPSYQAAASAIVPDGLLRQAMFVESASVFGDDPVLLALGASATDDKIEALRQQYGLGEGHVPVGQAAELMVIADIAQLDAETEIGRIALVYGDEAVAQAAAAELDRRLGQDISLLTDRERTLQEIIEARGGGSPSARLQHDETTDKWVLIFDVERQLIQGNAQDDTGRLLMSGSLAKLWVDMIYRRDLLWLA